MSRGFVYILTNPSMAGIVKIGKTTRSVSGRAQELYQTGVPTPFVVAHSVETPDCHELELKIHKALAEKRVSESREFFRTEAANAARLLLDEQRCQIEEWLDSFFPNEMLIQRETFIDPGTVSIIAYRASANVDDVDGILEYLRPEDLTHATEVYHARRTSLSAHRIIPGGLVQ